MPSACVGGQMERFVSVRERSETLCGRFSAAKRRQTLATAEGRGLKSHAFSRGSGERIFRRYRG